jgi:protein-disulfide isomerase
MNASRRAVMIGGLAALCACQQGGGADTGPDPNDMAIGDPHAKVTVIEYASVTCPHCREFHEKVWPKLKANYIDTGKIKFIFREFPTPPVEVAVAGFQVARCAANGDPQKYFTVIDTLFDQQNQIYDALEKGQVRARLLTIAQSAGLSEDQFNACISDPAGQKRVDATVQRGVKGFKIEGTPTLIVGGRKLGNDGLSYAGLAKAIDAKLKG